VFGRAQGQGPDTCLLEKRTINSNASPGILLTGKTIINQITSYLAEVLRRASGLVPRIRETQKTTSSLPSLLPHDAEPTSLLLRKRRARTRSLLRPEKDSVEEAATPTIPVSYPANKPTSAIPIPATANTTTIPFTSQSRCQSRRPSRELFQSTTSCAKVLARPKSRTNTITRLRSAHKSTTTHNFPSTPRRRR
jgi:hypothetical protein